MEGYRRHVRNASWLVFAISLIVYYFSVERVGSLWDVGEFILGAHKLQVVHPPGAPLFLLIGRVFASIAELFSDNPSHIAFAVNLLSGICTAFAALFIAQVTGLLGKLALVGRDNPTTDAEGVALGMASLCAGLATAFATSIWFSAVEGEVYAMSTLFTTMTLWAMVKWYLLPDTPQADRWIVFAVFVTGLSVGVHLLSLLTFPALAMLYYYKKYPAPTRNAVVIGSITSAVIALLSAIVALVSIGSSAFSLLFFGACAAGFGYLGIRGFKGDERPHIRAAAGGLSAALVGVAVLVFAQAAVIKGIPALWAGFDRFMVNSLGLPFHSGLVPVVLLFAAGVYFGLRAAAKRQSHVLELVTMSTLMLVIGFSVVGVVVIRANANPPINMNAPIDAMRLQYYLNREQYGDRSLLYGPSFEGQRTGITSEDTYGRVGDRYEVVDQKMSPEYRPSDMMLFPRMYDASQGRPAIYRNYWMGGKQGKVTMGDNLNFFVRYQLGWMYWRYFMWNFSGRQNHAQGFFDNDPTAGNWITGIDFVDEAVLGVNLDEYPSEAREEQGRNAYFALPLVFGLIGLLYHLRRRPEDMLAVLALFVITGIGIIIYTNQPPNEPRERDYVQAGAVFVYCIWIGMGVLGLFDLLRARLAGSNPLALAAGAGAIVLTAPALMAFQGFDDHSRMEHRASRDYAANFLVGLAPNAILFTYGDNDTYPLWYAQEVEGIRPDVRVVNLSLIAVDWYIDLLRRKINESPAVKMTLPPDALRGELRNQLYVKEDSRAISLQQAIDFVGESHPVPTQGGDEMASYVPTDKLFIPVTREAAQDNSLTDDLPDSAAISRVDLNLGGAGYIMKDDLAVMDVLASNLWERPIYFAVTVPKSKLLGLADYTRLEGMALRVTPFRSAPDPTFGQLGSGRVDANRVYENVTEKFAFGNFDTERLFVDPSYGASVQAMQLGIIRAETKLLEAGDPKRAGDLARTYLRAFPHENFPFNDFTILPIQTLLQTGDVASAKTALQTMANSLGEWQRYYESQDPALLETGPLSNGYRANQQARQQVTQMVESMQDPAFKATIEAALNGSPAEVTATPTPAAPAAPDTPVNEPS